MQRRWFWFDETSRYDSCYIEPFPWLVKETIVSDIDDISKGLTSLLEQNRDRLKRIVRLRLDGRLQGRIDESDVIQEAFTEAAERFADFDQKQECSPFVWLRFLTLQKLAQLHRHHFKVQARTVNKEVSPRVNPQLAASSSIMAIEFAGAETTPSQVAMAKELQETVAGSLEKLDPSDREILAMRHYEHLSNQEASEVLDISTDAAYKRYVRALKRLKVELGSSPITFSG